MTSETVADAISSLQPEFSPSTQAPTPTHGPDPETSWSDDKLDMAIHTFWSAFPCPPPWRPRLLLEVNGSSLEPRVTQRVRAFLAGKCDIGYVLTGDYDLDPPPYSGGLPFDDQQDSSGNSDLDSTLTHAGSNEDWCDLGCQMAVGCGVLFLLLTAVVGVLLCFNRSRSSSKLPSTRPSRQQLQLSSSISDHNNVTEFSNLEVQGDDDIIFPPFRQRNLPTPPVACYPCCDPSWNCPACSSLRPLMNMSPSGHYYATRTYSAVYETIDDEEEDENENKETNDTTERTNVGDLREATARNTSNRLSWQSYIPCTISTVQVRPHDRANIQFSPLVAETGFNGDELERDNVWSFPPMPQQVPNSTPLVGLPTYFELEKSRAFAANPVHSSSHHPVQSADGSNLRLRHSTSTPDCPSTEIRQVVTCSNKTDETGVENVQGTQSGFLISNQALDASSLFYDMHTCPIPSSFHLSPPPWESIPGANTFVTMANTAHGLPIFSNTNNEQPPRYTHSFPHSDRQNDSHHLKTFQQWVPQTPCAALPAFESSNVEKNNVNSFCSKCQNVPQPPSPPSHRHDFNDSENLLSPRLLQSMCPQANENSPDLLREAASRMENENIRFHCCDNAPGNMPDKMNRAVEPNNGDFQHFGFSCEWNGGTDCRGCESEMNENPEYRNINNSRTIGNAQPQNKDSHTRGHSQARSYDRCRNKHPQTRDSEKSRFRQKCDQELSETSLSRQDCDPSPSGKTNCQNVDSDHSCPAGKLQNDDHDKAENLHSKSSNTEKCETSQTGGCDSEQCGDEEVPLRKPVLALHSKYFNNAASSV